MGRARSRSPPSLAAVAPQRVAFVTLATAQYGEGARVLTAALRRHLDHTVDVLVFSAEELLLAPHVQLRPLADLPTITVPRSAGAPVLPQFAFCWAKLGLWALEQYDVVVYMDSDMLAIGDLTRLWTRPPPRGAVAAVPACQCWCGEECPYTSGLGPGQESFYFNAGLLVLRPCLKELGAMLRALNATSKEYPFAEQDFLNEHFRGRVLPLPPTFNALKYAFAHSKHQKDLLLRDCAVIHFVMVKPWERAVRNEEEFAELYSLWFTAKADSAERSFRRVVWEGRAVHPDLPGLWYVPEFVCAEAEGALLRLLYGPGQESAWRELSRRRVLCLGGVPHEDGAICEALPEQLHELAEWLLEAGALSALPDQCFVNSYSRGQGIDAHMDGPRFLPEVALLTFEGPALLRFGLVDKRAHAHLPRSVEVMLQPRSLLVFKGAAYQLYVHSVAHTHVDTTEDGSVVPRAHRRTSLTFRRLAHVQLAAEEVTSEKQRRAREAQFDWFTSELSEID